MSKGVRISDEAYEHVMGKAQREVRPFISQMDKELGLIASTSHQAIREADEAMAEYERISGVNNLHNSPDVLSKPQETKEGE